MCLRLEGFHIGTKWWIVGSAVRARDSQPLSWEGDAVEGEGKAEGENTVITPVSNTEHEAVVDSDTGSWDKLQAWNDSGTQTLRLPDPKPGCRPCLGGVHL